MSFHRGTRRFPLAAIASSSSWPSRVIANGGAPLSLNTINAANAFWAALTAAGISSLMTHINLVPPDGLIACKTPFLKTTGLDPYTAVGATTLNTLDINGLSLNQASANYFNTGIDSTIEFPSANNGGFSIYYYTAGSATKPALGARDATPSFFIKSYYSLAGNTEVAFPGQTRLIDVAPSLGFLSCNRVSSTDERLYFASSLSPFAQVGQNLNANAVALANIPLAVWGLNNNGTNGGGTDSVLSFIAFHQGLTSSQAQSLFNAVQTYRKAIGGGFI